MRDKLIDIILAAQGFKEVGTVAEGYEAVYAAEVAARKAQAGKIADALIAAGVVQECVAKTLEEWGEDYGDVLWWTFPIEEPPYVGSPLDERWPGYHTHWTPVLVPAPPKEE